MDIKPHMKEMENEELSQKSAECFNHIPMKHEAQHQNREHSISADEQRATVENEDCIEATVKTELFEFYNFESNENSHQEDAITVVSEKMMKTETNNVGVDLYLSYTCEERDHHDLYNNLGKKSDSNSDSDPERDPFADVRCDPSFSQTPQRHNFSASASATVSGLIKSRKTVVSAGSVPSSSSKRKLSTARILKHNFQRKTTLNLDYTLQCHLCLGIQGSEGELKNHLEICAASHRLGNRFCVLCNKLLSTSHGKKSHVLNVHKISVSIQCGLCLEKFNSESELKTHLEICAPSHLYSSRFCVPCNKLLCTVDSFKNHAFNKHGIARGKQRKKRRR